MWMSILGQMVLAMAARVLSILQARLMAFEGDLVLPGLMNMRLVAMS